MAVLSGHAQHEHAGGNGIRQVGIGHGGPQHEAVFQREGGVDNAGAYRQVQGQVAVRALTHMVGTVRRQADGMRILQVAPQHRQRHDQHKQQPKRPLLRLVKGRGRATVAPQPCRAHKQRERAQGQPVRRMAEAHRIGPQNGQPHQQKHAQRQAQINAQHGLEPRQEQPCNHCATREKQHQIHDGKQAPSSLYAQHGAEELHRGLERSRPSRCTCPKAPPRP